MSDKYNIRQIVQEAADAHTRLNAFYALIAILEGGCLPGGSSSANEAAETIIDICKDEASRQLELYDGAQEKALRLTVPQPLPSIPLEGTQ